MTDTYIATLENGDTIATKSDSKEAALKEVKKFIVEKEIEGNVVDIIKDVAPLPDNTHKKLNNGYYFPAWGIHVAAGSLKEAKAHIKEHHGKDVDTDIPPPKQA